MNGKSTLILVALALILAALIFWVERPARLAGEQPVSHKVLPDFDAGKVTAVEVFPNAQIIIRAEQSNHVWRLTKPVSYPASAAQVDGLLKVLGEMEWRSAIAPEELTNRADAQEQFGFDKPAFSLVLDGSGPSRHLLIGKPSAIGDEVYLQVVGNPSIYVADARFLKILPVNKDQWRDRAILDPAITQFDGLRVRSAANRFELEKDAASGLWRMKAPLQVRADAEKIEALLSGLRDLRVSNFVSDDSQADLDAYGLQTPALDLGFTMGTNQVLGLQIGAALTNNSGAAYARRSDPSSIVVLPLQPFVAWEGDQRTFLDHHLISVSPSVISVIEVRADDEFTLRRQTNGQWKVAGAKTFDADQFLVDDWLSQFTNFEVQIEQTVVADLPRYGLDKPVAQYTLKSAAALPGRTNQILAQIQFGVTRSNRVFESRADESPVNSIAREQFDRFPRASWQLRDRRLWHIDPKDIVSITVEQGGSARKLIRDPNFEWTLAPGSKGGINPFYLEETVHRLAELKAIYWDGRGADPDDSFGIVSTDYSISLDVKAGSSVQTYKIQFGKPSPYHHPYAAVNLDGQRLIFEFPVDVYNNFVLPSLSIPPAFRQKN